MDESKKRVKGETISCPICGEEMEFVLVEDAVVDVCEAHGIWLNSGELKSITSRIANKAVLGSETDAEIDLARAKQEGKLSGWLLGPLSFLFKD